MTTLPIDIVMHFRIACAEPKIWLFYWKDCISSSWIAFIIIQLAFMVEILFLVTVFRINKTNFSWFLIDFAWLMVIIQNWYQMTKHWSHRVRNNRPDRCACIRIKIKLPNVNVKIATIIISKSKWQSRKCIFFLFCKMRFGKFAHFCSTAKFQWRMITLFSSNANVNCHSKEKQ